MVYAAIIFNVKNQWLSLCLWQTSILGSSPLNFDKSEPPGWQCGGENDGDIKCLSQALLDFKITEQHCLMATERCSIAPIPHDQKY